MDYGYKFMINTSMVVRKTENKLLILSREKLQNLITEFGKVNKKMEQSKMTR